MRLVFRVCVLVLLSALMVACGGDDSAPGLADTATPLPATPPPAPDMTLGPIVWTESTDEETGGPQVEVDTFTIESPAIIALFEAENVPAGTEFIATWTFNGEPISGAEMHVEASGDMPHAWISFRFTRAEGQVYPRGTLGVEITSSSGDMIESSVEIDFP